MTRISPFKTTFAALVALALAAPAIADPAKFRAHAGKVMELADGSRYVIYPPLEQVWQVSPAGNVQDIAEMQPGSDSTVTLNWHYSEAEEIDLAAIDGVMFLDETPPIIAQLEQIVGARLRRPVGPLPLGTQLRSGGRVHVGNDRIPIGDWHILGDKVRFTAWTQDSPSEPVAIDPTDLIAALAW